MLGTVTAVNRSVLVRVSQSTAFLGVEFDEPLVGFLCLVTTSSCISRRRSAVKGTVSRSAVKGTGSRFFIAGWAWSGESNGRPPCRLSVIYTYRTSQSQPSARDRRKNVYFTSKTYEPLWDFEQHYTSITKTLRRFMYQVNTTVVPFLEPPTPAASVLSFYTQQQAS